MVQRAQIGVLSFEALSVEALRLEALTMVDAVPKRILEAAVARQRSFYAGRAVLRRLMDSLGILGKVRVVANPQFGYVQLSTHPQWHINLSHTENIAVAALSASPVGVDVERLTRPMKKAVFERVTTDEERKARQSSAPGWASQSIVWWSAKESVSKACGLGIKFGMRDFVLRPEKEKFWSVLYSLPAPFQLEDAVVEQIEWNGYVISVCAQRSRFPVNFIAWGEEDA